MHAMKNEKIALCSTLEKSEGKSCQLNHHVFTYELQAHNWDCDRARLMYPYNAEYSLVSIHLLQLLVDSRLRYILQFPNTDEVSEHTYLIAARKLFRLEKQKEFICTLCYLTLHGVKCESLKKIMFVYLTNEVTLIYLLVNQYHIIALLPPRTRCMASVDQRDKHQGLNSTLLTSIDCNRLIDCNNRLLRCLVA